MCLNPFDPDAYSRRMWTRVLELVQEEGKKGHDPQQQTPDDTTPTATTEPTR